MTTVGVISDTHGLLRPGALEYLAGSDLIVHAGDIGKAEVIEALERVAPVHAIRGNIDRGDWASVYPETRVVEVDDTLLYVLHDRKALDLDPAAAGFAAVISGHSHKPVTAYDDGVLYFNPGSAGPRRFTLPIALGRLEIDGASVIPTTVELDP